MHQFYTILHTKCSFNACCYIKDNFKNNKACQKFLGEGAVRSLSKPGNVTLIHPMNYKPQIFAIAVLQCLVDKHAITYKNIWNEDVARPHGAIVTLGDYR